MVLGPWETQRGNTKEARQTYEKVLARYPQFSPALKALVVLPGGSGNDAKDYELAAQARKAFPEDAEVTKALGRAMYKRGEYSSAKKMLQQATKLLPKDAEAYYYLGMSSHKLGNKTQGREDLQRAVDLVLPTDLALEATRVLLAPQ